MYLKSLELVGFKSFAERTKLEFEPGMTAIVGPNGCGKSNVSDAIRWVLGEQSARALRGSKMEDVIFTGTDHHKPLAMAEVSITLADCEECLGTEFHEVTVTRRVFRSGEGQYFINKTPCRLKDLQRLFMDTGVGTNSYSLMEQGRIDMILSARPDDRREVFEEASGITKFKADKKEAIRKLEHTEANLLRLSDIIREVKRQIISLQRQVGKAKRYKTLQDQLRRLDIYLGRERLDSLNRDITALETKLAGVSRQEESLHQDVEKAEVEAGQIRERLSDMDRAIADAMDTAANAKNELERARETIRNNTDRIQELTRLSQRDARESEEARASLDQHRQSLAELAAQLKTAIDARNESEKELAKRADGLTQHEKTTEETRRLLHRLRTEAVDLESRLSHLQNELVQLEGEERSAVIRRERLAAEKSETERVVDLTGKKLADIDSTMADRRAATDRQLKRVDDLVRQRSAQAESIKKNQLALNNLQTRSATRKAQIELLKQNEKKSEGFPGGAKLLLDENKPLSIDYATVLGPLAEHLHAEADWRPALESALRAWLDAVVVADIETAFRVISQLQQRGEGSARVLYLTGATDKAPTCPDGAGTPLLDHVKVDKKSADLARRLLGRVRVVEELSEIPQPIPPGVVYVTRQGALARGDGIMEYWMAGEHEANPLARRHTMKEWQKELDDLHTDIQGVEKQLQALQADETTFERTMREAQLALEESRRNLALCEGERQIIAQQATQARERAETVAWELESLQKQSETGGDRKSHIIEEMESLRNRQAEIRTETAHKTDELQSLEEQRTTLTAEVTDVRIRFAERRQQADHLAARKEPLEARIREIEALVKDRSEGINSYQARIRDIEKASSEADARIEPLRQEMEKHTRRLEEARGQREQEMASLSTFDASLRTQRARLDELRAEKSSMEVELAEQRMRRQNLTDRITADYHIAPAQIQAEPEPEWENNAKPDRDTLETTVAEIRTKLDSMGPVNLVAIEEHDELEKRFTFLTQQQDDLINAKQQLLDLIRKINNTTTDMFQQTFEKVNANFQELFKKMFGGGSAKLVLVDEENVLESGIEIIARPPGKKLQSVSLLSGGERTMTAVALLFALYMVKPSAFCVLDELDAALDESNIGRFLKVLEEFLMNSQFIVITHNRQTIGAADVLYGVTMEQHGVSKIVSVKFSHHEKKKETPDAPAPAETAEVTSDQ